MMPLLRSTEGRDCVCIAQEMNGEHSSRIRRTVLSETELDGEMVLMENGRLY